MTALDSAKGSMLQSQDIPDSIPKNMADALEYDDPYQALLALSNASAKRAQDLSNELSVQLTSESLTIPESLVTAASKMTFESSSSSGLKDFNNPLTNATASADSILNSLTKIASGGSEASQDIRQLEQDKRDVEQHAQDVETAIILRKSSDMATETVNAKRYDAAAQAIQEYRQVSHWNRLNDRAKAYAGEYTIKQLENNQRILRKVLLEKYETAVQQGDLQTLGRLTPLLPKVELEKEAVSLYVRFLQKVTALEFKNALHAESKTTSSAAPYLLMARIYNCAVTILRHHLPMVSHCLHKANGDAAVAQLIHVQVEKSVIPIFNAYVHNRELAVVATSAAQIYALLEEKYSGRGLSSSGADEDLEGGGDCGFAAEVGTLGDVDSAMEEAALCLQHAESYTRFLEHTVREINKAGELRFKAEKDERRMERERQEWATGMSTKRRSSSEDDDYQKPYQPLEILPARTQLQEVVAEVGGYYSGIERCLLLASMQRAFVTQDADSSRIGTPLGIKSQSSSSVASKAMQTALVETCFYAARRGTQRAFATGHTGTASAMANFCGDCLGGVLLQVLSTRVEEGGVAMLKPGERLLAGSAGIFNVSLMGQTTQVNAGSKQKKQLDEAVKKQKIQHEIAAACATFNDLEVASHHTRQLEDLLTQAVETGFPPHAKETEQLRVCVKSFVTVSDSFKIAADAGMESLVSILKPRIRSIVGEVVASEGTGTFMGSMGVAKASNRVVVRMDYDLDDESYQMLQLGEGFMSKLFSLINDLIHPLQPYLAPRLWDALLLDVIGFICKRLEASLRKCHFSALGALSLDSDMRDLLSYAKDQLDSPELKSNVAIYSACIPIARLMQISRLMNVDDLEDVADLISSSKRKGNWDLKVDDVKAFLSLRNEFDAEKVNDVLRLDDD